MTPTLRSAVLAGTIAGALFWPLLDVARAQATPNCAGATVTLDGQPTAVALCRLPACPEEDGNPNGQPCLWTDKPTGAVYYVDSGNY